MDDRSDLVGKWLIDHDYEKGNNPMPLWAKTIWDCRQLIVETSVSTKFYSLVINEWVDEERLNLGVVFGFQLVKYANGEHLVLTDIPKSVPGWISNVTIKGDEIWTEKHKATLLHESKPNLIVSVGQATLL